MIKFQIEAMPRWPYPEAQRRKSSPFRADYDATLRLLRDELEALDASGAVALRVVGDADDVRKDGMLRTRANITHPGVAVSFTSKFGPLTYPCDTFITWRNGGAHWQANLRAVALGLEKLRALDRYGIAGRGEQYAGWRAIEAPASALMTSTAQARAFLIELIGPDGNGLGDSQLATVALRKAHPDYGGTEAQLSQVLRARGILGVRNGS
jgi:hypothetical protein